MNDAETRPPPGERQTRRLHYPHGLRRLVNTRINSISTSRESNPRGRAVEERNPLNAGDTARENHTDGIWAFASCRSRGPPPGVLTDQQRRYCPRKSKRHSGTPRRVGKVKQKAFQSNYSTSVKPNSTVTTSLERERERAREREREREG